MYLHGSFVTQRKEVATVEIVTHNDLTPEIEISRGNGIVFTSDPVEIIAEVNDTFDPLFRTSASIKLLTRGLIPDLFCSSVLDAVVNISLDGKCVFAGYVVPQSYSQPFANSYDELEINCIDALSALQYLKYRDIGTSGVKYEAIRSSAGMRCFKDLLEEIIGSVYVNLDLSDDNRCRILYDGSIGLETGNPVFEDISISELLYLGSSEDETWSKLEVVEEIMRYLDLHLIQQGMDFFIYSLSSVKATGSQIDWVGLDEEEVTATERQTVTISTEIAMGTDAKMSVGEVFNRLELTCDVKEMENLVESPLDDGNTRSPYTNRQLYVREYSVDGKGDNDAASVVPVFKELVNNGKYTKGFNCVITDWYMQVNGNLQWKFLKNGSRNPDLYEFYCHDGRNQQQLPNHLGQYIGAALVEFGKVKKENILTDNSLTGKISMEKYLVVSVNGNGKDSQTESYPTEGALLTSCPVAEYVGNVSGGVFSPTESDTTNYIIFSGRMVLNPLLQQIFPHNQAPWLVGAWPDIETNPDNPYLGKALTVPSKSSKKGKVYCTKWYAALTPTSSLYSIAGPGLMPFTGDVPEQYEFKYSAIGDSNDHISKIGVLACMLIIGDKCVVEVQHSEGQVSDFLWRPYKTREECATDDEYYAQSFTLGFDPKIGDKLIGTEFDLQNNIDYRMGLDMEGTAIPIKKKDKVSGKVTFRILGPVNTIWDEVTRRHKTWFRRASWSSTSVPLLAHVSSIMIKNFKVTVNSDNGLINNSDDCDLVYMSDTDEKFVNVKDNLKFRITTALTTEERKALGISDSLKLSSPVVVSTGEALLEVHNAVTGVSGKPEKLYVDGYYREYHKPRIELTHKLRSDSGKAGQFNSYIHPALPGKRFFVQGISRGLSAGWAEVNLKEIDDND